MCKSKICNKCGEVKVLEDFSKQKGGKFGRNSACKVCRASYQKKYNASEAGKASQAKADKKYNSSDKGKAALAKAQKKHHAKSPEKQKAVQTVNYAITAGKLTRPSTCSHCGCEGKIEFHHWSYLKENWLSVIPLCVKCHNLEHHLIKTNGYPSTRRLHLTNT